VSEHYERAKSRLRNGTHNEVARAQAEATLALAHEQRTANLIALHAALRERRDNREAMEILTDIKERLGL
jgi:hypothetical protein